MTLTAQLDKWPESVHALFAQNALIHPGAIALIWVNKKITYFELNHAANCGASALIQLGVLPGSSVPILLPRSPELIISLLAVLKAGAAYILLDLAWSEGRLREVIEFLKPPLLIARNSLAVPGVNLPVYSLSSDLLLRSPNFSPIEVKGDSLCCIFFTSGTMGHPKGVLSPHRATIRLFQGNSFAHFSSNTIMPLAASLAWDAFSLELWGALLNGGTSWIIDEPYLSANVLRDGIVQHKVNTIWITSSLFNVIVEEDLNAFTGLQQIMTGGERLSVSHVKRFLQCYPTITLINGYGPVENTVFTTTHPITLRDCDRPGRGIPIGCPVPGTQVYILSDTHVPCEERIVGEISIAGDGLALGYLHDTALTEKKFIKIALNGSLALVYRTGDLGYWENGLLYFKGRTDRQVKIRGHRVELVEIEHQIAQLLPEVQACRVVARRDASNISDELIAFCIPVVSDDLLDRYKTILRSKLAIYQYPVAILSVEAFPLTSQGKLDERALIEMVPLHSAEVLSQSQTAKDHAPLMSLVAENFAAVLNRTAVPLDIPFLEFGSSSLDMGRICSRLSKQLDQTIPLSWFYRYPTIILLNQQLRKLKKTVSMAQVSTDFLKIPLSSMQLIYFTRYLANSADRTLLCLMVWIIHGDLNQGALEAGVDYVHRRHEVLRACYVPDSKPSVQLSDVSTPPLEILPTQFSIEEALGILRAELADELNPTIGDIWRVAMVPVYPNKTFVFGCAIHHIAFDGWSESLLAADLAVGYNSVIQGKTEPVLPLPSLAVAYVAQTSFLEKTNVSEHDVFLISELSDIPELVWPNDQASLDLSDRDCHETSILLTKDLMAKVDISAANAGVTRFVILLTHWSKALSVITDQNDFCIGVPVRQRYSPDLEGSIGCYINMICIRMRGQALTNHLEAVKATNRIVQRAFFMQEVPFQRVLQLINPLCSNRPPLFQTLFSLQDNPIPYLHLNGLSTEFLRQPYLDLPLELHAEIWLENDGSFRLAISHRPKLVTTEVVQKIAARFIQFLTASLSEINM